jgi:copper(I)-binding protein/cytochrome c-type biogenesis protein CcmH/NrfF
VPVILRQDSIIGVALPAPVGALYRDLLSPYCPGLSLASCPSPQADSLRKAIFARYTEGEPIGEITESLVEHYGPGVRGSPTIDGFGAVAFAAPLLLMLGGAAFILRWLRRNTARRMARGSSGASFVMLALGSAGLIGCGETANSAQADPLGREVRVESAWVRVGSAGAVTGAYGTVYNPSDDSLQLVGAQSPVADTVELHETMQHDGMVHMTPQAALVVPPRDSLVLTPGGLHFMVRALQRDLVIGETVRFTLLLADGRLINFPVEVRALDGRTVASRGPNASGAPRLAPGRKARGD